MKHQHRNLTDVLRLLIELKVHSSRLPSNMLTAVTGTKRIRGMYQFTPDDLFFSNTPNIPIHHKRLNQPTLIIHLKTNTTPVLSKESSATLMKIFFIFNVR